MSQKTSVAAMLFNWSGRYVGCAAVLGATLGLAAGFFLGASYSTLRGYNEQYLRERELIDPLLASDPAFADVKSYERSSGGIDLVGTVSTQADHNRLREWIVRAVGESLANEIVRAVLVHR